MRFRQSKRQAPSKVPRLQQSAICRSQIGGPVAGIGHERGTPYTKGGDLAPLGDAGAGEVDQGVLMVNALMMIGNVAMS